MNLFGNKNHGMLSASPSASPWQVNDVKSHRTDTYSPDTDSFTTNVGDDMGNADAGHTYSVSSEAVQSARFDPSDNSLNITYRGGDKEYKFSATPEEAAQWLQAPSKGRLTQEWRSTHRYPGY